MSDKNLVEMCKNWGIEKSLFMLGVYVVEISK